MRTGGSLRRRSCARGRTRAAQRWNHFGRHFPCPERAVSAPVASAKKPGEGPVVERDLDCEHRLVAVAVAVRELHQFELPVPWDGSWFARLGECTDRSAGVRRRSAVRCGDDSARAQNSGGLPCLARWMLSTGSTTKKIAVAAAIRTIRNAEGAASAAIATSSPNTFVRTAAAACRLPKLVLAATTPTRREGKATGRLSPGRLRA